MEFTKEEIEKYNEAVTVLRIDRDKRRAKLRRLLSILSPLLIGSVGFATGIIALLK